MWLEGIVVCVTVIGAVVSAVSLFAWAVRPDL